MVEHDVCLLLRVRPSPSLPRRWRFGTRSFNPLFEFRDCAPQSCAFRDHHAELPSAGAGRVIGLSTQSTPYQRDVVERLHLPFATLSDTDLAFSWLLGSKKSRHSTSSSHECLCIGLPRQQRGNRISSSEVHDLGQGVTLLRVSSCITALKRASWPSNATKLKRRIDT